LSCDEFLKQTVYYRVVREMLEDPTISDEVKNRIRMEYLSIAQSACEKAQRALRKMTEAVV